MKKTTVSKIKDSFSDGLTNLVANLGTQGDKKSYSKFQFSRDISREELEAMYIEDWLSRKVVDIIPNDMTRNWRKFEGPTPEQVEKLEDEERRLNIRENTADAMRWARLYGGCMILIVVEGENPLEPLNVETMRAGSLSHITVFDRTDVFPRQINHFNVEKDNFGLPETYTVSYGTTEVHHTRFLRFDGAKIPRRVLKRNEYWNESVLRAIYSAIVNFTTAHNSSSGMIFETNVDVVKVKGLMQLLSTPDGENRIMERFTLSKLLKSSNNITLLDQEEDYETKSNTFSGLPELIDRFAEVVSGACDIPVTRLLGRSPAGLTATGESDTRNYYDMISSRQNLELRTNLEYFDKVMAANLGFSEDTDLTFSFNPLWQPTKKEMAEVEALNAQRDSTYLQNNVITEVIAAKSLQADDTYIGIDDKFINDLEKAVEEASEEEKERKEQEIENMRNIINGTPTVDPDAENQSIAENEEEE